MLPFGLIFLVTVVFVESARRGEAAQAVLAADRVVVVVHVEQVGQPALKNLGALRKES
jgi:hypothetical protein